jgi:DNA-binding XRE family transcriptional regulator
MSKHLTQEVFSARVGISRSHLQAIEAGRSDATIDVARRIKETFRCSWIDLLDGSKK